MGGLKSLGRKLKSTVDGGLKIIPKILDKPSKEATRALKPVAEAVDSVAKVAAVPAVTVADATGRIVLDVVREGGKVIRITIDEGLVPVLTTVGDGVAFALDEAGSAVRDVAEYAEEHPFETALILAGAFTVGVVLADLGTVTLVAELEGAGIGFVVYKAASNDDADSDDDRVNRTNDSTSPEASDSAESQSEDTTPTASPGKPADGVFIDWDQLRAEGGRDLTDRIADAFLEQLKTDPGKLPGEISPTAGIPTTAVALRTVMDLVGADAFRTIIQDSAFAGPVKTKVLDSVTRHFAMMHRLETEYRMRAWQGTVTPEQRKEYIERIGDLGDVAFSALHNWYGVSLPAKSERVRARTRFDDIDRELQDEGFRREAERIYELIQNSDSAYKNKVTREEIEARLREIAEIPSAQ